MAHDDRAAAFRATTPVNVLLARNAAVPPLTVTPPLPKLLLPVKTSNPPLTVVLPLYVLLPASVHVPGPSICTNVSCVVPLEMIPFTWPLPAP